MILFIYHLETNLNRSDDSYMPIYKLVEIDGKRLENIKTKEINF